MAAFNMDMTKLSYFEKNKREPDFSNFLKVLRREKPDRATLFELFLNEALYSELAHSDLKNAIDETDYFHIILKAFINAGYDYASIHGSDMRFENGRRKNGNAKTISINEGAMINDWQTFKQYKWPEADKCDYSRLEKVSKLLPDGMKLMAMGPGGVLENAISLVGYEQLCYMIMDNPDLAEAIFTQVGSRLVRYYEICSQYDSVGMVMSNDDWGFKGQTMLSVDQMRKYVFPWHKKIVEAIHATGKPALLHSCGDLSQVMDDIIDDMKFDAKHSYEDNIMPVEEVYERWGDRIAILGGLDVDFLCRSTPKDIFDRASAMLERTRAKGGYALGSGNSIPYYIPYESYYAMIAAAYV